MLLMHASILLLGQWYLSFSLFSYPCNRDPSQIFVFVSTWLVNDGLELILVVVQLFSRSVVSDTLQPRTLQHARLPCPSLYLLEFAQTHVHWAGHAIQPSHPLSPPSSLALNLSQHQDFSSESALRIRWPKHWSFSFSISPHEYWLISFSIDWLISL